MTWLAWRQFRATAATAVTLVALLAAVLAATGPAIAREHAAGIDRCAGEADGCLQFAQQFFTDHRSAFLALIAAILAAPALIGMLWGAPLVSRELESGTHRLAWTQSVTRSRWLVTKLALVGGASILAAASCSAVVTWWSGPIDDAAATQYPRITPLVFAARGAVPAAYAAFAFMLGVVVGLLTRRTLPAIVATLAIFVAVQIAMPLLVRPHLATPVEETITISRADLGGINIPRENQPIGVRLKAPATGRREGAWVLASHAIDRDGRRVATISLPRDGACAPSPGRRGLTQACFAEIRSLGYRHHLEYLPARSFWRLQALETAIFLALALALAATSVALLNRRTA